MPVFVHPARRSATPLPHEPFRLGRSRGDSTELGQLRRRQAEPSRRRADELAADRDAAAILHHLPPSVGGRVGGTAAVVDAAEDVLSHDLSAVRFDDSEAAHRLNARHGSAACTYRDRIMFGTNQFAPDTNAGRLLLAHELSHVAQQRARATPELQHKLIVGGRPIDEPLTGLPGLHELHVALIHERQTASEAFTYTDWDDFLHDIQWEAQLRQEMIGQMRKIGAGKLNIGYPPHSGGFGVSSPFWASPAIVLTKGANGPEWVKQESAGSGYVDPVALYDRGRPGEEASRTPAKALKRIEDPAIEKRFDCAMTLVYLHYYGILKMTSDDAFNRAFPSPTIAPPEAAFAERLRKGYAAVEPNGMPPDIELFPSVMRFLRRVEVEVPRERPAANLIPGDWVYLKNHSDYTADMGFWSGEHAFYMGNHRFQGLGWSRPKNYDEARADLLAAIPAKLRAGKTIHDIPGLRNSPDGQGKSGVWRFDLQRLKAELGTAALKLNTDR